jgi:UDP-N-acetylglucosamine 2-epimerase (non-hydrolysing)
MTGSRVNVMVAFGTRPEALKLAPLIGELYKRAESYHTQICVTAQHREMLDQVLDLFAIEPDFDLNLMEPGQTLAGFASRAVIELDELFRQERPDLVFVQGDTTTTFAAALAGFYNGASIGHVEAGLRSFRKDAPFPEEINRRLTTHLTDLHFAPTDGARNNLLREGIDPERIYVTGNTVVDSLQQIVARLDAGTLRPSLQERFPRLPEELVLVTFHRRENHGKNLEEFCAALVELHDRLPDRHFFFPVHLHPGVQRPVQKSLSGLARVYLLPPLDYASFVWLMRSSKLILSDSGGVQEESCALGKRVLVMRETTERYEAVEAGFARLVGCDKDRIITGALGILQGENASEVIGRNPFGDGKAAQRIVATLASRASQLARGIDR